MGGNARLPSLIPSPPSPVAPTTLGARVDLSLIFQKNKLRLKRNDLRFAVSKGWKWDLNPDLAPRRSPFTGHRGGDPERQKGEKQRRE